MSKANIKLNDEQLSAVNHGNGPLLIIAGAGTGKTTVITERINYLISENLAKPSEILALTFTEKSAREMQARVDEKLPYGYTQMWVSTFHSFCDRVLRDEALHIGLDPRFKLMTEAETIQFIRENLFRFDLNYFRPLGNPTKFVGGLVRHFSRLQDEDISPQEYLEWVKKEEKETRSQKKYESDELEITKWQELSKAYKVYEELKVGEGVMDFGDLIVKTLKLFRDRKNILKSYQEKFKFILVDEFQDVNYAQNRLSLLLAGKRANITVCGDDDQSIYRFRGAAISNILQFKNNYKKTKIITLKKNYRSKQYILDMSHNLIENNNPDRLEVVAKIDKKLTSTVKSGGGSIVFFHESRVENESDRIAKEIKKLTDKNGSYKYNFRDVAILVRANNHAESFIRAFERHSLPYQFLGPGKLFRQDEVIDLISYIKLLSDLDDSVSLYRLLSMSYFSINSLDIARIGLYAKKNNISLFEACENIKNINISKKSRNSVEKIMQHIKSELKLVRKETAGQLLYNFLEKMEILPKLIDPDSIDAQKKAANISKFFDKLKSYEIDHMDAGVESVSDWIDISQELGESPLAADSDWSDVNAINILTVHSSKGLEFPVVFLVNLVDRRFPTTERRDQIPIPEGIIKEILPSGDYHLQEERRLFYVGMTRAKDMLYFAASDYYGEAKREKSLSPFIFEALGDNAHEKDETKTSQLSFLDFKESKNEVEEKIIPFHIDYLSYSQIQTYDLCPLHYKLKYLLKIPSKPSAALSFGTSVHQAMKNFYLLAKSGKHVDKSTIVGELERSWINLGYSSKSHEEKMKKRGKNYLEEYYQKYYDPKILPQLLEENFVIPLIRKNNERPLKIGGKMDRVDLLPDYSIEIIDYKTSEKVPSQREVDRDMQLTFYGLAAWILNEKPFGLDPKKIKLSLLYFEEMKKISSQRSVDELNKAIVDIYKKRTEIENSDFRCSNGFLCKNCEYKMLCSGSDF